MENVLIKIFKPNLPQARLISKQIKSWYCSPSLYKILSKHSSLKKNVYLLSERFFAKGVDQKNKKPISPFALEEKKEPQRVVRSILDIKKFEKVEAIDAINPWKKTEKFQQPVNINFQKQAEPCQDEEEADCRAWSEITSASSTKPSANTSGVNSLKLINSESSATVDKVLEIAWNKIRSALSSKRLTAKEESSEKTIEVEDEERDYTFWNRNRAPKVFKIRSKDYHVMYKEFKEIIAKKSEQYKNAYEANIVNRIRSRSSLNERPEVEIVNASKKDDEQVDGINKVVKEKRKQACIAWIKSACPNPNCDINTCPLVLMAKQKEYGSNTTVNFPEALSLQNQHVEDIIRNEVRNTPPQTDYAEDSVKVAISKTVKNSKPQTNVVKEVQNAPIQTDCIDKVISEEVHTSQSQLDFHNSQSEIDCIEDTVCKEALSTQPQINKNIREAQNNRPRIKLVEDLICEEVPNTLPEVTFAKNAISKDLQSPQPPEGIVKNVTLPKKTISQGVQNIELKKVVTEDIIQENTTSEAEEMREEVQNYIEEVIEGQQSPSLTCKPESEFKPLMVMKLTPNLDIFKEQPSFFDSFLDKNCCLSRTSRYFDTPMDNKPTMTLKLMPLIGVAKQPPPPPPSKPKVPIKSPFLPEPKELPPPKSKPEIPKKSKAKLCHFLKFPFYCDNSCLDPNSTLKTRVTENFPKYLRPLPKSFSIVKGYHTSTPLGYRKNQKRILNEFQFIEPQKRTKSNDNDFKPYQSNAQESDNLYEEKFDALTPIQPRTVSVPIYKVPKYDRYLLPWNLPDKGRKEPSPSLILQQHLADFKSLSGKQIACHNLGLSQSKFKLSQLIKNLFYKKKTA